MKPEELGIVDYQDSVRAFHEESDRGAAVLGGSFIDSYLAGYLKTKMIDDAPYTEMFEGFGPLADFNKRRAIAYSFGFISQAQYKDLKFIGKIRNHFAHYPLEAAFDKKPVSDWCNELSTRPAILEAQAHAEANYQNRIMYLIAIGTSIGNWHNIMLGIPGQVEPDA